MHFSLFFAKDLLLAVYFMFILYCTNDVRQKANSSHFLSSKWVIKQWRQLATSTIHRAEELLTSAQCSGGSSFAKEMRDLTITSIMEVGS